MSAEEGISLGRMPKIKVMLRFSLGGLSKPPTNPGGVVPKKSKALIQVCFRVKLWKLG
jgi:hypothetical protein